MIRLTLVCNASTAATRQGAFPADEPLDARGLKEATDSAKALKPTGRALVSPALRAMQTAEALGLSATPDDDLRDIDYGRWSGFSLTDIASREAVAVGTWLADPEAAPHGGESIAALFVRVGRFMEARLDEEGNLVAVTHAAVMRAAIALAMGAPASSFWRIDVAPLGRALLHGAAGRWRLRSLGTEMFSRG